MSNSRYMHPTLAHDLAESVSLYLGKPAECCLKFEHGLRRETSRGPRVLFTLTDERKLWVDPPVADKIEATVGAGEPFWICKRKSPGNSQVAIYDVWTGNRDRRQPAAEMAPPEEWENGADELTEKAGAAKMAESKTAPVVSLFTPQSAPDRPAAQELVEVARSYTFKLNVGNYESRDFFCSQKAECRPEDADLVSDKLYAFCKRQVMKAVAEEKSHAA